MTNQIGEFGFKSNDKISQLNDLKQSKHEIIEKYSLGKIGRVILFLRKAFRPGQDIYVKNITNYFRMSKSQASQYFSELVRDEILVKIKIRLDYRDLSKPRIKYRFTEEGFLLASIISYEGLSEKEIILLSKHLI